MLCPLQYQSSYFADHSTTTRIDVFAVRQWPGNGMDLDFRGVLGKTTATIVAAARIELPILTTPLDEGRVEYHPSTVGTH